jgi:ribosomal protein S12 methylthiotransferase RimO
VKRTVALVTLGCARNDVDSEELAGRLASDGWLLVDDPAEAEIAVINTCGFIESAKKDSIDAMLQADTLKAYGITKKVVAVGCMAERYGKELASALPEADGILGFDDYQDISARLSSILSGRAHEPHVPQDRRALLPIAPVERAAVRDEKYSAAMGAGGAVMRKRLDSAPWAPLKIASGCDRRCSFCAIPYFRGSFVSRRPTEIITEAKWLADNGVSEIFLVSENTTSYGKDLGDIRLMEKILPDLSAIDGIERIRLSYLQPAEMRPTLIQAMIESEKVVPYFDLSFQHASEKITRAMRRFGDTEKFLHLISQIRVLSPEAGIRSNFIVGFPGESESDYQMLADFLSEAKLDAIGIFGYSDEDNTEALALENKISEHEIKARVDSLSSLADSLVSERAASRIGSTVKILIESEESQEGRAAHQGPEVDGSTTIEGGNFKIGQWVTGEVIDSLGADLIARAL